MKIAFVGARLYFRACYFFEDYVFGFWILGHEESISGNKVVYISREAFFFKDARGGFSKLWISFLVKLLIL